MEVERGGVVVLDGMREEKENESIDTTGVHRKKDARQLNGQTYTKREKGMYKPRS